MLHAMCDKYEYDFDQYKKKQILYKNIKIFYQT